MRETKRHDGKPNGALINLTQLLELAPQCGRFENGGARRAVDIGRHIARWRAPAAARRRISAAGSSKDMG